eukprot:5533942-Pleurochrysis_carterae.AAC.1
MHSGVYPQTYTRKCTHQRVNAQAPASTFVTSTRTSARADTRNSTVGSAGCEACSRRALAYSMAFCVSHL